LSELLQLRGRVAVVTGAASGIGLQTVRRLCEAGAVVHGVDADADAVDGARREFGGREAAPVWHCADVVDGNAADDVFAACSGRVDVVVNNAGVFPSAPLLGAGDDLWPRLARVNVEGTLNYLTRAASVMKENRAGGAIVNLTSVTAIRQAPGFAHYGASKAAIISLTRSSAQELGRFGIRVNAVAPGGIETPGYHRAAAHFDAGIASATGSARPLERLGDADDVARAIVFLASDAAAYITGVVLPVDGGLTAA
jgi:NAD(P)-dependent dehydrogenase (short-subunit alcohol dehydrogenase family)